MFHEWWSNPDVLQIGSPLNVNDFRVHLVNGVFGNGTDSYPYYMVQVVPHMCYRMRFIAVMGEDVGKPQGSTFHCALPCMRSHAKIR